MINEACRHAGGNPGDTRSISVWRNALNGFQLRNCLTLMRDAGYKPSKTDTTLEDFVTLIRAGVPDTDNAPRFCKTFGAGIHAISFFSANEMLYRGELFNVQWSSKGKKCDPINGNGKAAGKVNGKLVRKGLFTLLADSVTRADWLAIKQLAQDAEQQRRALQAMREFKALQLRQEAEQKANLSGFFSDMVETFSEARARLILETLSGVCRICLGGNGTPRASAKPFLLSLGSVR